MTGQPDAIDSQAGATRQRFTIALCSIAFRSEPIEPVVARAADIGFDAVEVFAGQIMDKSDDELRSLRRLADEQGVALDVIAPYFALTRGEQEYDESIRTARRCVDAAHLRGATKIRTFTDVSATGVGSAEATEDHWRHCVRGLREMTAMDASLAFVLETHAHTLVDTVATTLTLIDRVAAPNLKVLYQPTTFVGNEGVEASFNALLPHIGHMHLQQQGTAEGPGWIEQPGDIDYPAFFDMVKASDYRGTASLEYCWKGVAWPEVEAGGRYLLDRLRG